MFRPAPAARARGGSGAFLWKLRPGSGLGPAAAVATIKKMKRMNSPQKLKKIGKEIREVLTYAAKINDLNIKLYGSVCLTSFELEVKNWQASLTLYTQEMLKLGILASDRVYSNLGHNYRSINYFKKSLIKVFATIKNADKNDTTLECLDGPTRISSFGRVGLKDE